MHKLAVAMIPARLRLVAQRALLIRVVVMLRLGESLAEYEGVHTLSVVYFVEKEEKKWAKLDSQYCEFSWLQAQDR